MTLKKPNRSAKSKAQRNRRHIAYARQRYEVDPTFREKERSRKRAIRERQTQKLRTNTELREKHNARYRVSNMTPEAVQRRRDRDREHYDVRRWKVFEKKYGVSKAWFFQTLEEQLWGCANSGCNTVLQVKGRTNKSATIDHCHRTGRVRGILCRQCNIALGSVFDDISRLQGLIVYLL